MDEDGSELEPWEQQPGEDPRSYHVFEIFCLMGTERSVRAAAAKWYADAKQTPPKNPAQRFKNIATKWRWEERADWYWRKERRRGERLLQARRDAVYLRLAALGEGYVAKLEFAWAEIKVGRAPRKLSPVVAATTIKTFVEASLKAQELVRGALGDTDEDRKRRGRPPGEEGSLPAIEDRIPKPTDETPPA